MAPVQSRPRDAVKENELTQELLDRACAGALGAACEAKWILVDEAVRAGRLRAFKALGAKYKIALRAARRAGTSKDLVDKLLGFTYFIPDFYAAAPLPDELIDIIVQFSPDGRTLARFSSCSSQLRERAEGLASERLARITTLRLGQPAVADWKTNSRLLEVLTNPPSLRSVLGPGAAWAPIRDHVKGIWPPYLSKYLEPKTDYGRKDHRAAMVKWALQLGDAALIEGVMRTTDPGERSPLRYDYLHARKTYLITSADSPAWCSSTIISRHFQNVERVQYCAANRMYWPRNSRLRQLAAAAAHDRYFPGSGALRVDDEDVQPYPLDGSSPIADSEEDDD